MRRLLLLLALVGACLHAAPAGASLVSYQTRFSASGPLGDAGAYRNHVEGLMAVAPGPGYGDARPDALDGLANWRVFGGNGRDIATRIGVEVFVPQRLAGGIFDVRFGLDFGRGGALFLDGRALGFRGTDMWWAGDYGRAGDVLAASGLRLGAGAHSFTLYGLEGCCDGTMQGQWRVDGGAWTTFARGDGLDPVAVPEPTGLALLALALGVLCLAGGRRRKAPV